MAIRDFVHDLFLQLGSNSAGRAKTAALMGKEMGVIADKPAIFASALEYGKSARSRQILKRNGRSNSFQETRTPEGPPTWTA